MRYRITVFVVVLGLIAYAINDYLNPPGNGLNVSVEETDQPQRWDEKKKSKMSVKDKKKQFFAFLMPYIQAENMRLLEQRRQIIALQNAYQENGGLNPQQLRQLTDLLKAFRVIKKDTQENIIPDQTLFAHLLNRVDIIPVSLALAQAANESAWGTSRFATEGNNYFGQWCFRKGCGLVPNDRSDDASHEVAKFDSVSDSIKSYFRNINTHKRYKELRDKRAVLRQENQNISGMQLAGALHGYSERGEAYVEELRVMIRVNKLGKWDDQLTRAAIDYARQDG